MVSATASALTPLNLAVTSSRSQLHQVHNSFLINIPKKHISVSCLAKLPGMEHLNEPTKLIALLSNTRKKLWNVMPDPIKSYPWKKAETVVLEELLVLGKETLKWCLLAYFAFSFLSDIFSSISRNKELVISLGLFVGVMTTKLLDEISRELMPDHQHGGIHRRLLSIASIFILVKVSWAYFSGTNHFLLHAANGGLMQVLWSWKEIQNIDEEKSSPDAILDPINGGN